MPPRISFRLPKDDPDDAAPPSHVATACVLGFLLGTAIAVGSWAGAVTMPTLQASSSAVALSPNNCAGEPCANSTLCRSGADYTCGTGPDWCNAITVWSAKGCCPITTGRLLRHYEFEHEQSGRQLSTCTGAPCTCAGCCRSSYGYCNTGSPWCNDQSIWTPTCAPTPPTSSPTSSPSTTTTTQPTTSSSSISSSTPTTKSPSSPPTTAPTAIVIVCPTSSPTTLAPLSTSPTATHSPTAPTAPTAPTTPTTAAPNSSPVTTTPTNAGTAITGVPTTSGTTPTYSTKQVGVYFAEWGIYGRNFQVKNLIDSGQASVLTFVNYAFANIYLQSDGSYQCNAGVTHTESGGQDGGDQWALYGKGFTAAESVDGVADVWNQPLKGNMNQLKKLKVKFPKLKIILSIGGWTWSKYFSAASATDSLRKTLVASCVDQFIKGNLPVDSGTSTGGTGSGAGVFDGIDVDWEYPGVQGIGTNTVDPFHDPTNQVLLFQEFRTQLDAYGTQSGQRYLFTTAIGAALDKIQHTLPSSYAQSIDWANLMSYDYNGAWNPTGPTDFQSNLYGDSASPNYASHPDFSTDAAVKNLLAAGFPKAKLNIGIPFYGRGWTGVAAGSSTTYPGLYQTATGAAAGTYEAGIEDYKVLKTRAGTVYRNTVTHQSYKFAGNGGDWWSYDTIDDVKEKVAYMNAQGLCGVFAWSADGDTTTGELTAAMAGAS